MQNKNFKNNKNDTKTYNISTKTTIDNLELKNIKLEQIADRILTEHKYAFEVLGNGEI